MSLALQHGSCTADSWSVQGQRQCQKEHGGGGAPVVALVQQLLGHAPQEQ